MRYWLATEVASQLIQHTVSRTNRHSPDPEQGRGYVDEGEVVASEPVEPCGEAAEVLELVEAALDAIAQLVGQGIVRDRGSFWSASRG